MPRAAGEAEAAGSARIRASAAGRESENQVWPPRSRSHGSAEPWRSGPTASTSMSARPSMVMPEGAVSTGAGRAGTGAGASKDDAGGNSGIGAWA